VARRILDGRESESPPGDGSDGLKRRATLKLLAGTAAAGIGATIAARGASTPRPNVLVVLIDDLRHDEFGAGGHPYLETPSIDRLAREGVSFTRAFHSTPLCSPNRACILTGEYASKHGIFNNVGRDRLSAQLRTFPRALQASGYQTAHVGKWHMGDSGAPRPGYDYWLSFAGQGKITDPELNEDGRTQKVSGYVTDILTERAVHFLTRRRDRSKPFCLFLAHKAIHPDTVQRADASVDMSAEMGYLAAPRHRGRYAGRAFPLSRSAAGHGPAMGRHVLERVLERKRSPETMREFGSILNEGSDQQGIRDRAEMMLSVDEGIGTLLDVLESEGVLDDTVVVFTSDNGYFFGEHGLTLERRFPYEECIRSPLLFRHPARFPSGRRVDALVSMIDVAPTLLELCGVAIGSHVQGRSFVPLLTRRRASGRDVVLVEYYSHDQPMPWILDIDYRAVRTDRYKLIHWLQYPDFDELYDLAEDPLEMVNLASRASARAMKAELRERLRTLIGESLSL
jgi:arylsulfatase A-like enzyme